MDAGDSEKEPDQGNLKQLVNPNGSCTRLVVATPAPAPAQSPSFAPSPLPQSVFLPMDLPPPRYSVCACQAPDDSNRPFSVNDALDYLDAIKFKFQNNPDVYNDFLAIMSDFKNQRCVAPDVCIWRSSRCRLIQRADPAIITHRVSMIFAAHPALIEGFFLPPVYRIEDLLGPEDVNGDDHGEKSYPSACQTLIYLSGSHLRAGPFQLRQEQPFNRSHGRGPSSFTASSTLFQTLCPLSRWQDHPPQQICRGIWGLCRHMDWLIWNSNSRHQDHEGFQQYGHTNSEEQATQGQLLCLIIEKPYRTASVSSEFGVNIWLGRVCLIRT